MQLGRYEIVRELGRGAMGAVYEARDPKIDRTVAIKTIAMRTPDPEQEEEYRRRFFREAQAAGKLTAGGIVAIYDIGEDEATHLPFIVMEFVRGQALDQYVAASGGRLPLDRALDLISQVATALDYAHAQGIIHRDIKPANIMVTPDGHAKIADFGIAKFTSGDFTHTGQVLGTPAYMSPEQLTGAKTIDGRSDLFSLGVVAYWLFTGQKPFLADNPTSLAFQIVYKDPAPPREVNQSLGEEFDYVLQRMLAKDPAARYPRGRELAADLDDLRNGRKPRSIAAQVQQSLSTTLPVVPQAAAAERTAITQPVAAAARPTPASDSMQTTPLQALSVDPAPPLAIEPTTASVSKPRAPVPPPATPVQATAPLTAAPIPQPASRPARRSRIPWIIGFSAALVVFILAVAFYFFLATRNPKLETGAGSSLGATLTPISGNCDLTITGNHYFRSAEMSVWLDGQLIYQEDIHGTVHSKTSYLVHKSTWTSGRFELPLKVPEGKHTITVKIKDMSQNYLQTESIDGSFSATSPQSLHIDFGSSGKDMLLSWQ